MRSGSVQTAASETSAQTDSVAPEESTPIQLTIVDPVSSEASSLAEELWIMVTNFQSVTDVAEAEANESYQRLRFEARGFAIDYLKMPRFYYRPHPESVLDDAFGLPYLLDYFSEFSKLFIDARAFFDQNAKHRSKHERKSDEDKLRAVYERFDRLSGEVNAVTPLKLQLQIHLQTLALSRSENWVAMQSFSNGPMVPLARLRDRYFATPSPVLLSEYQTLSESTLTDPNYIHDFVPSSVSIEEHHRARIEAVTLELELLSMLDIVGGGPHA
jgi:hypothetical protein